VREGDPRGQANLVGSAADHYSVRRIRLSALSAASVAALVRAELGPAASAEFCSGCWELAGGNPLFVGELLTAARNEGLSGAEDNVTELRALASSAMGPSVLGRLARLGPDAVALAQAVLGAQTEVGIAAELAALEPAAAELTADRLAAAQILAPARPLDFFHPLIAESVYADLGLGARRLAHRRAAAILDRAGATDRVAAHLLATGPAGDAWVVERLSAVAGTAWERGAAEVAASYLRRALAEPATPARRPAILLRLGVAEWAAGEPTAIGHLEEALNEARDGPEIAVAAGPLANALIISDQADAAVPLLDRVTKDDVVIAALPLFHIYGLQITLNLPLAAGATVVILPRFELAVFLRAMQDYRVTRAEVVPPMILGAVTAHVIDGYDLSALRLITSAAAPLSVGLARACARRLGCRVKQAYGMTEVSGGTHIAPDDGPDRPESIGPALPGVECRIVEPGTGTDLGPNEPGELLVRSAGVMRGYLGNPRATAATIDEIERDDLHTMRLRTGT
jgi:AMP-binding enzyme